MNILDETETEIKYTFDPQQITFMDAWNVLQRNYAPSNKIITYRHPLAVFPAPETRTICLLSDWATPEQYQYYWASKFTQDGKRWNSYEYITDPDQADILVIINKDPHHSPSYYKNKSNVFYFTMEPYEFEGWSWNDVSESIAHPCTHRVTHNIMEWHLSFTYNQLKRLTIPHKLDRISCIQSEKLFFEGHHKRRRFMLFMNQQLGDLDCFGHFYDPILKNYKGQLPQVSKEMGLLPYKYHFCAENHMQYNYVTEKIVDAILCECLVFYWGCPNLEQYLPHDSFIRLELTEASLESDLSKVRLAIQNNEWQRRLPAIRLAKHWILDRYSCFAQLERLDLFFRS
jgi:hypothetical protein